MTTLLLVLAVVGIGGAAGWYFKSHKSKRESVVLEDYPDEPDNDAMDYDDAMLWNEEDGD